MADDDEYDFDDPRFLLVAAPVPAELSYADKRKRKLAASFDKSRSNPRSRKQLEEDARAEGLATNLIARDTEGGGESKALKMMKGMGFTPGEGLGKKRKLDDAPDGLPGGIGSGAARGGLGARPAPAPAVPKTRTEPIKFTMRDGRTGLGVPGSSKGPTAFPPTLLAAAEAARAAHPLPDVNQYLERNLGLFNERKAVGILRSVRKTLEELDRRAGMEDSVMWKAPEDKAREDGRERARRAFRSGDVDPEDDFGVDIGAERAEEDRRGKGLEYARGVSGVVIDQESDDDEARLDKEEEQEWLAFDAPIRLALTLAYLRTTYNYCFWCGCQYDDPADLAGSCPGEDEQDH